MRLQGPFSDNIAHNASHVLTSCTLLTCFAINVMCSEAFARENPFPGFLVKWSEQFQHHYYKMVSMGHRIVAEQMYHLFDHRSRLLNLVGQRYMMLGPDIKETYPVKVGCRCVPFGRPVRLDLGIGDALVFSV